MEYTLEWVREKVKEIKSLGTERPGNVRVHPNGFIQFDLGAVQSGWHESHKEGHSGSALRLHIWNPPDHILPHQKTVNEVHDHVFDMQSNVVRGSLTQRNYFFQVGREDRPRTHEAYIAVYNKTSDSRLEATGVIGHLVEWEQFDVEEGQIYEQPAFTLHDTGVDHGGCVVTVMEKRVIHKGNATVICPVGTPPDNSYDRQAAAPADFLYAAIDAALA